MVLVIIGITATLAAPAILRSATTRERMSTERVIANARSVAVRRGETLALDIADRRYRLLAAYGDSATVASGTIDDSAAVTLRLLITPLGLCLPDGRAAVASTWDVTACRATTTGEGAR